MDSRKASLKKELLFSDYKLFLSKKSPFKCEFQIPILPSFQGFSRKQVSFFHLFSGYRVIEGVEVKFNTLISWGLEGWLNCWILKSFEIPIHFPFKVSRRLVIEPPQRVLQQVLLLFGRKKCRFISVG